MKKVQLLLSSLLLSLPFSLFAQSILNGEVNGDGEIDVTDATRLISMILNGSTPVDEGDWVDLGLPSGTIWATRNVGASSPEDYGDYFAWGEAAPKSVYNWDTYQWSKPYQDANGNWRCGYTKYCTSNSYGLDGFVDSKTELDPLDDAAYAHYPGGCMPSAEQIDELCDYCSWQWTQQNGVNGQLITGRNGNTMFLPAAGYRWGDSLGQAELDGYGYYWSRTLNSDCPHLACNLDIYSGGRSYWYYGNRYYGFTVRAVRAVCAQ